MDPASQKESGMTTFKASLRSSLLAAAAAGLCSLNTGCLLMMAGLGGGDGDFLEGDDVRISVPSGVSERAGGDMIRGDVYSIVDRTIDDTNGWVTGGVEGIAAIYRALDRARETSRDGDWRVYGPYDDDDGRDLAWLARLDEDAEGVKKFEFYVGPRGVKGQEGMDLVIDGQLAVDGDMRSGGFNLYFDAIEAHPDMKEDKDSLHTFAGAILVSFKRDVATEAKTIDIKYDDFQVLYDGYLDSDTFFSDESYNYKSNADGTGDFHLALYGQWDDWGWSGPETEKMVLDMAWDADGAGRSRGQILEVDGVGDLKHGDLIIHECFVADGWLDWREINEAYVDEVPDYNFGEESSCVLGLEALPG